MLLTNLVSPFIAPLLVLFFAVTTGCTTYPPSQASWVRRYGGMCAADHRRPRLDALCDRLLQGHPHRSISVSVLASAKLGAFGWPDGRLYVTRGLVDALDDDMLAASVAHELGHLILGGHLPSPVSLSGSPEDADEEMRADAVGVALLEDRGFDPGSMARMLAQLRAATASNPLIHHRLGERIDALRGRTAPRCQ